MHLQLWPIFLLERRDGFGRVSLDQGGGAGGADWWPTAVNAPATVTKRPRPAG
jgi:hypothetical protein